MNDPKAAEDANPARGQFISTALRSRGFLPEHDPATGFPSNSEYAELDEIGRDPDIVRLAWAGFRQG